jgi:hypothetical protein
MSNFLINIKPFDQNKSSTFEAKVGKKVNTPYKSGMKYLREYDNDKKPKLEDMYIYC